MNNEKNNEIIDLINKHKILVFMKGPKIKPLCGFSNQVIKILNQFPIEYHTINVLEDREIRDCIKLYSNWPTIPQVYINGQFIGGTDIITSLYQASELEEILEKALNC